MLKNILTNLSKVLCYLEIHSFYHPLKKESGNVDPHKRICENCNLVQIKSWQGLWSDKERS